MDKALAWGVPPLSAVETGWVPDEVLQALGGAWPEYQIEVVGWAVSAEPPGPFPFMAHPNGGYLWIFRRQAWPTGSAVFLREEWEGRPTIDLRPTFQIAGLEHDYTSRHIKKAERAIGLFRNVRRLLGGRPPNTSSGFISELEPAWWRAFDANDSEPPTREQVADQIPMGLDWFKDQFRDHIATPRQVGWRNYRPAPRS